jgi:hypothetical protein
VKSRSSIKSRIEHSCALWNSEDHAHTTIVPLGSYGLFDILEMKRSISTSVRPFHNLEWRCEER